MKRNLLDTSNFIKEYIAHSVRSITHSNQFLRWNGTLVSTPNYHPIHFHFKKITWTTWKHIRWVVEVVEHGGAGRRTVSCRRAECSRLQDISQSVQAVTFVADISERRANHVTLMVHSTKSNSQQYCYNTHILRVEICCVHVRLQYWTWWNVRATWTRFDLFFICLMNWMVCVCLVGITSWCDYLNFC